MKYADDQKTVLIINDHIRLGGIPAAAHQYQVNGRTPLEWFIDRSRITRDMASGLVNDPDGRFKAPHALTAALRRIVQMSVETARLVATLPEPFARQEANRKGGQP